MAPVAMSASLFGGASSKRAKGSSEPPTAGEEKMAVGRRPSEAMGSSSIEMVLGSSHREDGPPWSRTKGAAAAAASRVSRPGLMDRSAPMSYSSTSATSSSSPRLSSSSQHTYGGQNGEGDDSQAEVYLESDQESDSASSGIAGPEEYVVALHDFTSNNATCLSFASGQVIKVFNRDSSGWWDGELDGERGWFPSNYVDEGNIAMGSPSNRSVSLSGDSPRQSFDGSSAYDNDGTLQAQIFSSAASIAPSAAPSTATVTSHSSSSHKTLSARSGHLRPSRSPTPTTNNYQRGTAGSSSSSSSSSSSVLDPILHAISLLHNAVRANRIAHFQPSTACVISSVRSVLSATDCLTRETTVLKAHPVLAKERKLILSELSRLVTQARTASTPTPDEAQRIVEMDEMLKLADCVLKNVRRFLDVAVECGVSVPDRRSSVYDDLYADGGASRRHASHASPPPDRSEQDKTPTPQSPRSSAYLTAYTSGQMSPRSSRSYFSAARNSSYPVPEEEEDDDDEEDEDLADEDEEEKDGRGNERQHMTQAARIKAEAQARHRPANGSAVNNILPHASTSSTSLASLIFSTSSHDCNPEEVLERLNATNDQLLSIIAAFIGHIHSHSRDSHASSFAHLIDMTREIVDGVRALLVIVEAVHDSETLKADMPRPMAILKDTRESLYEATTALVTAARIVTSAPAQSAMVDEDEKEKLLNTATSVLRTGGECVGAVRLCLNKADTRMLLTLPPLLPAHQHPSQRSVNGSSTSLSNEGDEDEDEDGYNDEDDYDSADVDAMEHKMDEYSVADRATNGVRRGKHTLSFLGRKATSLSCLREKYEQDSAQSAGHFDQIDEDEDANDETCPDTTLRKIKSKSPSHSASGSSDSSRSSGPSPASRRRGRAATNLSNGSSNGSSTGSQTSNSAHKSNASLKPETAVQMTESTGDGSDSSEPMSRDHSRASGSTLDARSDTTADTSARPSMDRSEPLNFDELGPMPHTAPVNGSFGRDRSASAAPQYSQTQQQQQQQGAANSIPRRGSDGPELSSSAPAMGRARAGSNAFASMQQAGGTPSPTLSSGPRPASGDQSFVEPDYGPNDIIFNSENQVTGATLSALVERMTPHDTTIDATFATAFFLCFRLFTTPMELLETLEARYNMRPSAKVELDADEYTRWMEIKVAPVRLRVFNFFKTWLEAHWNPPTDFVILDRLIDFIRTSMTHSLHRPGQRLADLALKRQAAGDSPAGKQISFPTAATVKLPSKNHPASLKRMVSTDRVKSVGVNGGATMSALSSGGMPSPLSEVPSMYAMGKTSSGGPAPTPIVSKALLSQLRVTPLPRINIIEFDATELARQLTILESKIYCSIQPEELIGQEFSKKAGVSCAVNVKSMSSLSTHITGWISECILGEFDARKRTQLIKFFVKLGDVSYDLPPFLHGAVSLRSLFFSCSDAWC